MFKLSRRENLIPFMAFLGLGLAASIVIPPYFSESIVELPTFTLFPAEIALVLILSVLFFENATPTELLRLSFTMLAIAMGAGALCNLVGQTTQTLPDGTLLLNWVQLITMNLTGLVSTIAFYQSKGTARVRPSAVREVGALRDVAARGGAPDAEPEPVGVGAAAAVVALGPGQAPPVPVLPPQKGEFKDDGGESARDILEKLDVRRIERLEKDLQQSAQAGAVSLESLFADESTAAAAKVKDTQVAPEPQTGGLNDYFNRNSEEVPMPRAGSGVPPLPVLPNIAGGEESFETVEVPILDKKALFDEPLEGNLPEAPAPVDDSNKPKFFEMPKLPAEAKPAQEGRLFDDVSGDIDDIFSNLAAPEAQQEVSEVALAKVTSEQEKAAQAPAEEPSALFDDVSADVDELFANLAAPDAQQDVGKPVEAAIAPPLPTTPVAPPVSVEPPLQPAATAQAKADGGLFDDVSGDLDDIFSSIAAPEAQREVTPETLKQMGQAPPAHDPMQPPPKPDQAPAPAAAASGAREIKEFGRLSAAATSKVELATPGTLKTIGQMLLDTQAVENIIKHSTTKPADIPPTATSATAKIVTVDRGADIQSMLNKIAAYPGINGTLVIGKDGLLIGATDSLGPMRDVYGVLALGIFSTTGLGTKKVEFGELRQAVLRGGDKVSILFEVGVGVLAAFSDVWNLSALPGILEHIEKTVKEHAAAGVSALPTQVLSAEMLEQSAPPPQAAPAVQQATPPVQAAPPVPQPPPAGTGLLNVSDGAIGDLFDNLLEPAAQAAPPQAAPSSMDFTPNVAAQAAPLAQPTAPTPPPIPAAAEDNSAPPQQIKEFGRLSSNSASQQGGAAEGAIKAIGRQLIDVQAVENIIKAGERREKMGIGAGLTTARVISAARGEGIKTLLTKIDSFPGVAGSLIVGNDGLVIASTLTTGPDKDLLGALCTAMHSHSDLAAKKLDMGKLRQLIFHTNDKLTVLTGVAVGVLAVFVENNDVTKIDSLLTAIETTVRG